MPLPRLPNDRLSVAAVVLATALVALLTTAGVLAVAGGGDPEPPTKPEPTPEPDPPAEVEPEPPPPPPEPEPEPDPEPVEEEPAEEEEQADSDDEASSDPAAVDVTDLACDIPVGDDDFSTYLDDAYRDELTAVAADLEPVALDLLGLAEQWQADGPTPADLPVVADAAQTWQDATATFTDDDPVTPRWEYRSWHLEVTGAWEEVCDAIMLAAEAAEGDDEAYDAFDAAVTVTPTLPQRLLGAHEDGPDEWVEDAASADDP